MLPPLLSGDHDSHKRIKQLRVFIVRHRLDEEGGGVEQDHACGQVGVSLLMGAGVGQEASALAGRRWGQPAAACVGCSSMQALQFTNVKAAVTPPPRRVA